MPRVQRSPPSMLATDTTITQVASDSDIPLSVSTSPVQTFITSRHKRPRSESSPTNELLNFKKEIKQMLRDWKTEQEQNLSTFLRDQSATLTKLISDIAELKLQNIAIQKSNMEIEKSVIFINEQYDDLKKQIECLHREKQSYRDSISILEAKILDLQQSSRASAIEIRNVTQLKEKETTADLTNIVEKVGSAISMDLNKTHIRDIYRLPGKQGTTRPIVTEFTTVRTKLEFLTNVREFNKNKPKEEKLNTKLIGFTGECRPIFAADFLPASSRKLYHTAREFARLHNYKYC